MARAAHLLPGSSAWPVQLIRCPAPQHGPCSSSAARRLQHGPCSSSAARCLQHGPCSSSAARRLHHVQVHDVGRRRGSCEIKSHCVGFSVHHEAHPSCSSSAGRCLQCIEHAFYSCSMRASVTLHQAGLVWALTHVSCGLQSSFRWA